MSTSDVADPAPPTADTKESPTAEANQPPTAEGNEPPTADAAAAKRKLVRRVAFALGSLAAVGAAVLIARSVLSATVFTPDAPVREYVAALERGDADGAARLLPGLDDSDRLTNSAWAKAGDHPSGGHVVEVTGTTTSKKVRVSWQQAGGAYDQTFLVEASGHRYGLLPRWRLANTTPGYSPLSVVVPFGFNSFVMNGDTYSTTTGRYPYLLPGTYTVALPVTDEQKGLITSTTQAITVHPDGMTTWDDRGADPAGLTYSLTDTGAKAADAQMLAYLNDTCWSATTLDVPACAVTAWQPALVSKVHWQMSDTPQVQLRFDLGSPVLLHAVVSGHATATYTATPYWSGDPPRDEVVTAAYAVVLELRPQNGTWAVSPAAV